MITLFRYIPRYSHVTNKAPRYYFSDPKNSIPKIANNVFSQKIEFSKDSAAFLNKNPFVLKFLKEIQKDQFIENSKNKEKAVNDVQLILKASQSDLVFALFKTGADLALKDIDKKPGEFPLYEIVEGVTETLKAPNKVIMTMDTVAKLGHKLSKEQVKDVADKVKNNFSNFWKKE